MCLFLQVNVSVILVQVLFIFCNENHFIHTRFEITHQKLSKIHFGYWRVFVKLKSIGEYSCFRSRLRLWKLSSWRQDLSLSPWQPVPAMCTRFTWTSETRRQYKVRFGHQDKHKRFTYHHINTHNAHIYTHLHSICIWMC